MDGLGVEVLGVTGVLLLHRGGQAQHEGARLRSAVVEGHVTLVSLLALCDLLGIVLVRIEAVDGRGDAVQEAHVHLALVVPRVLDGPAAPEVLGVTLVG